MAVARKKTKSLELSSVRSFVDLTYAPYKVTRSSKRPALARAF